MVEGWWPLCSYGQCQSILQCTMPSPLSTVASCASSHLHCHCQDWLCWEITVLCFHQNIPRISLAKFPSFSCDQQGVPSSCADRENLFLLITGMYFYLNLNLLDLTKALWNVQCQFYAWKNREVNWVVKGEGKPGSILLSQAILPIIWFPDLARNTTVSIWKWGRGGGKVK